MRHLLGSRSAQTGPRGLAGAGAEPTSHCHLLSPTWQGESPSAGNFSAPSHSSQPAPRQAFSVSSPGAKEHLSLSHIRHGRICCQEASATPPQKPSRLCHFSQHSVSSSHREVAHSGTSHPFYLSVKTHSQGESSQICWGCSRHHQGLK